jgi:hypothetical protein
MPVRPKHDLWPSLAVRKREDILPEPQLSHAFGVACLLAELESVQATPEPFQQEGPHAEDPPLHRALKLIEPASRTKGRIWRHCLMTSGAELCRLVHRAPRADR